MLPHFDGRRKPRCSERGTSRRFSHPIFSFLGTPFWWQWPKWPKIDAFIKISALFQFLLCIRQHPLALYRAFPRSEILGKNGVSYTFSGSILSTRVKATFRRNLATRVNHRLSGRRDVTRRSHLCNRHHLQTGALIAPPDTTSKDQDTDNIAVHFFLILVSASQGRCSLIDDPLANG